MSNNDSDDIDNVKPFGDAGRCTKKSSKRVYSKRRKFAGNQYKNIKIKMVEMSNVIVLLVVMHERQPFLGKRLLIFLFLPPNLRKTFSGTGLLACLY